MSKYANTGLLIQPNIFKFSLYSRVTFNFEDACDKKYINEHEYVQEKKELTCGLA
jgi:hypothetical protein